MLLINNKLLPKKKYKNILLLIGHCLQLDECEHKITSNILNCKSCGKCDIAEILKIEKKYGIIIKVATGGRLAKKLVSESGCDLVIAVACERELWEGLTAVYPTGVFAIENIRPSGPCVNTKVDINYLKESIEKFL